MMGHRNMMYGYNPASEAYYSETISGIGYTWGTLSELDRYIQCVTGESISSEDWAYLMTERVMDQQYGMSLGKWIAYGVNSRD